MYVPLRAFLLAFTFCPKVYADARPTCSVLLRFNTRQYLQTSIRMTFLQCHNIIFTSTWRWSLEVNRAFHSSCGSPSLRRPQPPRRHPQPTSAVFHLLVYMVIMTQYHRHMPRAKSPSRIETLSKSTPSMESPEISLVDNKFLNELSI